MDSNEETTKLDPVDADEARPVTAEPTPAADTPRARRFDGRAIGFVAAGIAAPLLAFVAGMAIGDDRDDRHEVGELRRGGGPGMGGMPGGGRMGGMDGSQMRDGKQGGGQMGRRGSMGGRGHGAKAGGMRGGGGGIGIVTKVDGDTVTVEPLSGRVEELTATLDEDTKVTRRGDDGVGDVEQAERSDIDEGDIVTIRGDRDAADDDADDEDDDAEAKIDAAAVLILRDAE